MILIPEIPINYIMHIVIPVINNIIIVTKSSVEMSIHKEIEKAKVTQTDVDIMEFVSELCEMCILFLFCD